MTRNEWCHHFLDRIDAPHTEHNARALVAWAQAEGGDADWNVWNTTSHTEGDGSWLYNSVGVREFPNYETGMNATVRTILESGHGYERIIKRLRANAHPYRTCRAIDRSDWGTQKLIFAVLADIVLRGKYWAYAQIRVAGS